MASSERCAYVRLTSSGQLERCILKSGSRIRVKVNAKSKSTQATSDIARFGNRAEVAEKLAEQLYLSDFFPAVVNNARYKDPLNKLQCSVLITDIADVDNHCAIMLSLKTTSSDIQHVCQGPNKAALELVSTSKHGKHWSIYGNCILVKYDHQLIAMTEMRHDYLPLSSASVGILKGKFPHLSVERDLDLFLQGKRVDDRYACPEPTTRLNRCEDMSPKADFPEDTCIRLTKGGQLEQCLLNGRRLGVEVDRTAPNASRPVLGEQLAQQLYISDFYPDLPETEPMSQKSLNELNCSVFISDVEGLDNHGATILSIKTSCSQIQCLTGGPNKTAKALLSTRFNELIVYGNCLLVSYRCKRRGDHTVRHEYLGCGPDYLNSLWSNFPNLFDSEEINQLSTKKAFDIPPPPPTRMPVRHLQDSRVDEEDAGYDTVATQVPHTVPPTVPAVAPAPASPTYSQEPDGLQLQRTHASDILPEGLDFPPPPPDWMAWQTQEDDGEGDGESAQTILPPGLRSSRPAVSAEPPRAYNQEPESSMGIPGQSITELSNKEHHHCNGPLPAALEAAPAEGESHSFVDGARVQPQVNRAETVPPPPPVERGYTSPPSVRPPPPPSKSPPLPPPAPAPATAPAPAAGPITASSEDDDLETIFVIAFSRHAKEFQEGLHKSPELDAIRYFSEQMGYSCIYKGSSIFVHPKQYQSVLQELVRRDTELRPYQIVVSKTYYPLVATSVKRLRSRLDARPAQTAQVARDRFPHFVDDTGDLFILRHILTERAVAS